MVKFAKPIAVLLIVAAALAACDDRDRVSGESVAVSRALTGDTTGYARATSVPAFSFPDDHGPHPAYKTEWWYFTGNLDSESGRHFGYQFTVFRVALTPPDTTERPVRPAAATNAAAGNASDWRTNQFFMAHFAVSDAANEQHHPFERFSRGAAGLAGAEADPFRVWLEDWSAAEQEPGGDADLFPLRLQARGGDVAVDLRLRAGRPKVLQGDRGLSQKGPGTGNASYYYSFTRLPTSGTVTANGETFSVEGRSWMDREWSTSALGAGQSGWDWFALQLSDGRDLMYYRLRETGGTSSSFSEGVLVGEDGQRETLERSEVEIDVLDRWESPSGASYPVRWRLRVPSENLDLRITPYFSDQVMDVSVRYWEGAVQVEGTAGRAPVSGSGYVEMTGYGDGRNGRGEGILP